MQLSLHCSTFVCLQIIFTFIRATQQEDILLDLANVRRTTNQNFIGFTFDTENLKPRRWHQFNKVVKSVKLQTLGAALVPSFLRVGGTSSDFLTFEDDSPNTRSPWSSMLSSDIRRLFRGKRSRDTYPSIKRTLNLRFYLPKKDLKNYTMTSSMFDEVYNFSKRVGWNMTFDLNVFKRNQENWDPTNAIKLMDYVVKKDYKLAGWELGNEPNAFYHLIKWRLEPEQLAKDYVELKKVLQSYRQFDYCVILGPSVTQLDRKSVNNFFKRFMNSGGGDVVTAATFHQYYLGNDSATDADYTNSAYLNILIPEVATGVNLTRASGSKAKVWIGETSSAIGRLHEESANTYKAGFMWLDKLGVSAVGGVDVVLRQSFYGGSTSLIDKKTLEPITDYWLTLLFNLLVGNRVLSVLTPVNTGKLRSYAHCAATNRTGYRRGSIVVYTMNLYDTDRALSFPDFRSSDLIHLYRLEPKDGMLKSMTMLLNGIPLRMVDDSTLPNLLQPYKTTAPITIKPYTYMFIVFPDVTVKACL